MKGLYKRAISRIKLLEVIDRYKIYLEYRERLTKVHTTIDSADHDLMTEEE